MTLYNLYLLESKSITLGNGEKRNSITVVLLVYLRGFGDSFLFWIVNPSFLCCRNGGYCMHDEATSHYIDMIDQTTLGH